MLQSRLLASDPKAWLDQADTDLPVQFYAPSALASRFRAFFDGFPGLVTFAVKSNPDEAVLGQLVALGMRGFDVASPEEIETVARIAPGAALHYHNPVHSRAEIAFGQRAGVASWSVDDLGELEKLLALDVSGEIAVRLALPVTGAAYQFGAKFGAGPDLAAALLRRVAESGRVPALTFHVGTQCAAPEAWVAYVDAAKALCRRTGTAISTLNVGGGFPSSRDGGPVALGPILSAIRAATEAFPGAPRLVCEPGRGLVADAFVHAARVKSRRQDAVFLNDGIYGGLSEFPSMGVPRITAHRPGGAVAPRLRPMTLWGPTCDSLDRLPGQSELPDDIREGDWILFSSMGAYANGVSTRFNGYGRWQTVTVAGL